MFKSQRNKTLILDIKSARKAVYKYANDRGTKKVRGFDLSRLDKPSHWAVGWFQNHKEPTSVAECIRTGQALYEASIKTLFKALPDDCKPRAEYDRFHLRVVSDKTEILDLPWFFLADQYKFLIKGGWTISLCHSATGMTSRSPKKPKGKYERMQEGYILGSEQRLLAVLPKSRVSDHGYWKEELKSELRQDCILEVVQTFRDFLSKLQDFRPDIVYFCGHGKYRNSTLELGFDDAENEGKLQFKEVASFAPELFKNKLIGLGLFNCCFGDSVPGFGVAHQLQEYFAALVTTRGRVDATEARKRAHLILSDVLTHHHPPEISFASRFSPLELHAGYETTATHQSLYCNYGSWGWRQPIRIGFGKSGSWRSTLNRDQQFASIAHGARRLLREGNQFTRFNALGKTFIWFGSKDQGIDYFRERIGSHLAEELNEFRVLERFIPKWPDCDSVDPESALFRGPWPQRNTMFLDMLRGSLGLPKKDGSEVTVDDIIERIDEATESRGNEPALAHFHHTTIQPERNQNIPNIRGRSETFYPVPPQWIRSYLHLWQNHLLEPLSQRRIFPLITIPYIVKNPERFKQVMQNLILNEQFGSMQLSVLEPLDKVTGKDIERLFRDQGREPNPKIIERILTESEGDYEMTIKALDQQLDREQKLGHPRDLVYTF